jgi:antitoxin (DNA-binding transcriptional repressor) of toxin-antitoxin stability system
VAHLVLILAILRVAAGEEIVIAKAGKPIAKLVPYRNPPYQRVLGQDEGKVWIADDFDAPLPEDLQRLFE